MGRNLLSYARARSAIVWSQLLGVGTLRPRLRSGLRLILLRRILLLRIRLCCGEGSAS